MSKEKKLPCWDLSEYYKGVDDPKIDADIKKYQKMAKAFAKKYEKKVADLSVDEFRSALAELEKMRDVGHRLGGFAHLNFATNMLDSKAVGLNQKVEEELTKASTYLVFWSLEYNNMSDKKQDALIKKLPEYAPYLKRLKKYKKFELSEEVEKTLLEKEITSGSAWVRFYEESMARLEYVVDGKAYNDAEISKLATSKDEETRLKAGKEMNRVSKENAFMLAFCYNMIMKDKAIEDEKRGFAQPMSSRNLAEDVDDGIVDCLAETVRKNYENIAWRFYKIKAKLLGKEKIHYWDRNAPLDIEDNKEYEWEESVKIVLDAYKEFSPHLYEIAKEFFENDWIDVAPKKGKRGGAFCSSPLVKEHPFLMLNFVGKRHDVLTLAHELGHGCHHQLRRKNGELNETCRLTTEEVASVFGEMLVFQSMLRKAKNKNEKIVLLAVKINDMINTAIRQISFHFFEKRAHDERKNGELSAQRLSEIWMEEMKASLGPWVVVDEDVDHIWGQIGHLYFLPFYVYAYSFADCVVNSLYWKKMEGKMENFEFKYLELLSKTAIGDYEEIFKEFGINPKNSDFWQGGLNLISYYLDELEKLVD